MQTWGLIYLTLEVKAFYFFYYLFIYLVTLGQVLVAACRIFIAACGIFHCGTGLPVSLGS